jgi:hypothetical protein
LLWPTKRRVVEPVVMSHRRRVPSQEPDRANWPSEEMTTSCTKWEWPFRARLAKPYCDSVLSSCHTMTLLSLMAQESLRQFGGSNALVDTVAIRE